MKIFLNNNLELIDTNEGIISINDILKLKNYTFKMLIVRVNNKLVTKSNYDVPIIKENDIVDIIHLISGG